MECAIAAKGRIIAAATDIFARGRHTDDVHGGMLIGIVDEDLVPAASLVCCDRRPRRSGSMAAAQSGGRTRQRTKLVGASGEASAQHRIGASLEPALTGLDSLAIPSTHTCKLPHRKQAHAGTVVGVVYAMPPGGKSRDSQRSR